jgi:ATP-binding cassette subfamily B protein
LKRDQKLAKLSIHASTFLVLLSALREIVRARFLLRRGEMAHHGPEDVFIAVMTLLGAFVIMLLVHWKLALLTFIAVPILIWVAIVCNQRMTKAIRKMFSDIADYNARVEDNFGGIRVVQAFANEEHEKRLFAASNLNFRRSKLAGYASASMIRSDN